MVVFFSAFFSKKSYFLFNANKLHSEKNDLKKTNFVILAFAFWKL